MRNHVIRTIFVVTSVALAGCSSNEALSPNGTAKDEARVSNSEGKSVPAEGSSSMQGRVGDELEIDEGLMRFSIGVGHGEDVVSIDIDGLDSRTHWFVGFGQSLSLEQARSLVAGERVKLPGTSALAWGDFERRVTRPAERLSLKREKAGLLTLTVELGEEFWPMEGADVDRFGKAREASFTGIFSFSCYVPGKDQETLGDPTFSTDRCKQAADAIGLRPLLWPEP